MKALAVWNPRAGPGSQMAQAVELTRQILTSAGWRVDTAPTERSGHATELARSADGYDMVIAVGGDGTISEVLNGLVGSDRILGVIPAGTTNVWAREIGIPLAPAPAAHLLLNGEIRAIDVGCAGRRFFLLMAGVGLDAEVMKLATGDTKRLLGVMAYFVAGAWAGLTYRGSRATITLDGKQITRRNLLLMVIGNTRRYAFVELTPDARADDGLLDICIFAGREDHFTRLRHFISVVLRKHTGSPDVEFYRAREIRVETAQPLSVQVDGDYIGTTPMSFWVIPQAVRVVLPKAAAVQLFGPVK